MKPCPIAAFRFALPCFVTVAAALVLANTASAQTIWTGNLTNDWNTAGNWSAGLPTGVLQPQITQSGANVTMSAAGASTNLLVATTGATAPVLNITQNLTNNFSSINVGATVANTSGIINHTAGIVSVGGGSGNRRLNIAGQGGTTVDGTTGIYNFGGVVNPTLTVTDDVYLAIGNSTNGQLNLSGNGTFTARDFVTTRGTGAIGTLSVSGGELDINFRNLNFSQFSGGTFNLNYELTSTVGSTINSSGETRFGTPSASTVFNFNLSLDGFVGTLGQEIMIIDGTTAFATGYVFGNVANNSTISLGGYDFLATYDNTTTSNYDFMLTVTAVPEPSAALLCGALAGLTLLRRRRRA